VLDAFWDSKGYVTPAEYRRFCNTTVPLARLARRTFTTAETLDVPLEVTHFGAAPLDSAVPYWRLVDAGGKTVLSGELPGLTIPIDSGTLLGQVHIDFSNLTAPGEYRLIAGIRDTPFENDWGIWLYPNQVDLAVPAGVTVARQLDAVAVAELDKGGRVILFPDQIGRAHPPVSFTPIFWNNQLFPNEKRQTLGLLCNSRHPALSQFPTRPHSDWNWEDIVQGARAFDLAGLPRRLRPVIQIIDDWNTGRRLALALECRVGQGRLLVCGADLPRLGEQSPSARQLQRSLLTYAGGDRFNPAVSLNPEQVQDLIGLATPRVSAPRATSR